MGIRLGCAIVNALSYLKGIRLFWSVRNGFYRIYLNDRILYWPCFGAVLRAQNGQADLEFFTRLFCVKPSDAGFLRRFFMEISNHFYTGLKRRSSFDGLEI